jgi:hypothetical protein
MKTWQKLALTGIVLVLLIVVVFTAYRLFFEFNKKEINAYVSTEAGKYQDTGTATRVITDGVTHILSSASLTSQVKQYAKTMGVSLEKSLVDAAVLQAKAYGYL